MKPGVHRFILMIVAALFYPASGMLNANGATNDIDCSNPQDQASMGICQAEKTEQVRKELETVYNKVASGMHGGRVDLFKNYQRAWEKYIITKCMFDNSHYGSMFGQMVGQCEEKYYRKRIKELKRMLPKRRPQMVKRSEFS